MDARAEIEAILNSNENDGAVLLTGPWGCGKSYLIKEIAEEQNDTTGKPCAVGVISLFGVDSIAELHRRVKNEYLYLNAKALGEKGQKVVGVFSGAFKKFVEAMKENDLDSNKINVANAAVQTICSINPLDFVSIKSEIQMSENREPRKFVLVFDDLERCQVELFNLLGAINDYSENKDIRTIIIANEEEISREKYGAIKEKLIAHTIRLSPNFESVIHQIIEAYTQTMDGYSDFLKENENIIRRAFNDSKYGNLRALKSCIWDFERVYGVWKKTEESIEGLSEFLYPFCATVYEHKKGEFYAKTISKIKTYNLYCLGQNEKKRLEKAESIKNKYLPDTFAPSIENTFMGVLCKWIVEGDWDEETFIEKLTAQYSIIDLKEDERFLLCSFLDLEKDDLEKGFPILLNRAYEGNLNMGQLLQLLKKIHLLRINSILFPNGIVVSYPKIKAGLTLRKQKIKNKEVQEAPISVFEKKENIDEEALEIYEEIQNFSYQKTAWRNNEKFILYLEGKLSIYDLNNMFLKCFDDELEKKFEEYYVCSSNQKKKEMIGVLRSITFDSSYYSGDEDIQETVANFEKLHRNLMEMDRSSNDPFLKLVNSKLIEWLEEETKKLK